jgi:hypothetical protein
VAQLFYFIYQGHAAACRDTTAQDTPQLRASARPLNGAPRKLVKDGVVSLSQDDIRRQFEGLPNLIEDDRHFQPTPPAILVQDESTVQRIVASPSKQPHYRDEVDIGTLRISRYPLDYHETILFCMIVDTTGSVTSSQSGTKNCSNPPAPNWGFASAIERAAAKS